MRKKQTPKKASKTTPSTTKTLLSILTISLAHLTKAVNITLGEIVKSGKTYFRPVTQGPKPDHFSMCTSVTACFILNRTTEVWTNSALNTAYIYSNPAEKKSLVTGFTTVLLDMKNDTIAPVARATVPTRILRCVYTQGQKWVCSDGNSGSYIWYDVKEEKSLQTYSNTITGSLEQLTNKACSVVDVNNTQLFCVKLGADVNKIFQLNDTNGGGIPSYSGNFSFPANGVGSSASNGLLMVYSEAPVRVNIGEYATGKMLTQWSNDSLTGEAFSMGDLRMGLMAVVTPTTTIILRTSDGRQIGTLDTAQNMEFSEVYDYLYYVDKGTNQYSFLKINLNHTVANCQNYSYGVGTCRNCLPGFTLNNTNITNSSCTTSPNATLNNSYVDTNLYTPMFSTP
jgi:hypothetical protein